MTQKISKIIAVFLAIGLVIMPVFVFGQSVVNYSAEKLLPRAEIFISPRSGTFLVGSTFEVPVYIDTKGNNINAINLVINFDPKKVVVVNPSGGKSIIGIWAEVPDINNTLGTASFAGIIPSPGIVTSSGLIITMTFKVLTSGDTRISVNEQTSAHLNDGLGSEILLTKNGSSYTFQNRAPNGVIIYSDTHPSQDTWYNNNSPVFSWDTNPNINGFSVVFDNTATTIPTNTISNTDASAFYENTKDGIWYLHVKSIAKGIWGPTSHFQVRVDTVIPADFKVNASSFKDSNGIKKYMASFFTTDTMSGISHYEVGVINKNALDTSTPVFIQTESPYLVPLSTSESLRVVVHTIDNAGNISESYIDLYPGYSIVQILKKIGIYLLLLLILILIMELVLHYLFGHHVWNHAKRAYVTFKNLSKPGNEEVLPVINQTPKQIEPEPVPVIKEVSPSVPLPEYTPKKINQDITKYDTDGNLNSPTE